MKKSLYIISALLINASTLLAQSEKISVKAPGFARPLVEKLVSEYTKQHPDANIELVKGKTEDAAHTLQFTAEGGDINIARYAVVPVTASGSDAEQLLQSSHLNAKQLRNLFFLKDEFADEEHKESKAEKAVHIYTGNSQQSVARAYASRFNQETTNYKGKKISGDDSFLNIAISRDPLGVTINALSNVYDLKSRKLAGNLAIVPLDLDKQGRQVFHQGNLDEIISLLEQEEFKEIPVGNLGLAYNHADTRQNDFVHWILTEGTKYAHEYGLLNLSQKEQTAQLERTQDAVLLSCL
jgi:hypothetical protein